MRKFGIGLLAAAVTAGIPAMANAQNREDRGDRPGRPEGGRPDMRGGGDRGQQQAAPQQQQQAVPQQQAAPQAQAFRRDDDRGGRDLLAQGQRGDSQNRQFGRDGRNDGRDDRNDARGDRRDDGGRFQRGPDNDRRFDNRGQGFAGRPDGRFDDRRGGDFRPGPDRAWRPGYDWRADRSFDWRGYRSGNRQIFSIGRYYAPRGWGYGYRRFSIGYRLPSLFYAQNYWLADPYEYRLPPAYGPYRWVRYYDDVLLVDLRTGQIVDEIPDFFF